MILASHHKKSIVNITSNFWIADKKLSASSESVITSLPHKSPHNDWTSPEPQNCHCGPERVKGLPSTMNQQKSNVNTSFSSNGFPNTNARRSIKISKDANYRLVSFVCFVWRNKSSLLRLGAGTDEVGQKGVSLSTVWSHPKTLVFKNFQFFRIPKYNLSECSEGLNASLSNLLVSCGRIHWRHFAVKFGASDCISGQFLFSKEILASVSLLKNHSISGLLRHWNGSHYQSY